MLLNKGGKLIMEEKLAALVYNESKNYHMPEEEFMEKIIEVEANDRGLNNCIKNISFQSKNNFSDNYAQYDPTYGQLVIFTEDIYQEINEELNAFARLDKSSMPFVAPLLLIRKLTHELSHVKQYKILDGWYYHRR